jgi:hypothetical protein
MVKPGMPLCCPIQGAVNLRILGIGMLVRTYSRSAIILSYGASESQTH